MNMNVVTPEGLYAATPDAEAPRAAGAAVAAEVAVAPVHHVDSPTMLAMGAVSVDAANSDDSKTLIRMSPEKSTFPQRQAALFRTAFQNLMQNKTEGAMSSFLFHDLSATTAARSLGDLSYDASTILSGGNAWERRVAENAAKAKQNEQSFVSNDQKIIAHSLDHALLTLLPVNTKFVSYGGGDATAFRGNEGQIIEAALKDPSITVTDFCAVDILGRYAHTQSYIATETYGLESEGVRGDFLRNGRLGITPSAGTPVVMIFGGPFENVFPDADYPDTVENATIAWAKMNFQHGLGSYVIKTFDSEQDPDLQVAKYAPTRNFEAFELSFFARAIETGIIRNPQYDVFANWRMTTEFDAAANAVKILAECKQDHTLVTDQGSYDLKAGDKRTVTLSHKWDIATQVRIAERAGYEIVGLYKQENNPNVLMVAKAVNEPAPALLPYINFGRT
jgi:hypothetical protein